MSKLEKKKPIPHKNTFYFLLATIIGLTLIYQTRPFLTDAEFAWISVPAYSIIPGFLSVIAGILAAKLFKIHHYQAKAFLLFAIGAGCWFVAEQIWAVHDHILNEDPFPSEADWFYLAAYPFYFVFLIILLKPIWKKTTKKIIAFSILLSGSLLFPTLSYVVIDYQGEISLGFSIALAYPILSSILLVPVIIGIFFLFRRHANYSWMLLLFGFVTYSVADTVFMFTVLEDEYYDGHTVDLLYLYGIIFLIFSVIERINSFEKHTHIDPEYNSEQIQYETINRFGIPLVVVIIMITVLVSSVSVVYYNDPTEDSLLFIFGIIALLGVFSAMIFLLNFNLNKLVRLRTTELEKQHKELKNLVEKKSQEVIKSERLSIIGELAGRLSHDLRNPLSVMKMSLDLIRQCPVDTKLSDSKISHRLDSIDKSIDRILHQINDVLSFVRHSTLELSFTSLRNMVVSSIDKVRIPTNVKIHVPENDIKIHLDPVKIDAVFTNIIINAIQAMPQGGEINIHIKSEGKYAAIEFANTGPAIPEEHLSDIFEPLFTTKQEGTGLGLASCKNIVEQHGGTIHATNNPTTFTVRLPKKHETDHIKPK